MGTLNLVQLSSIIEGDLSKVQSADLSNRDLESIESLSCLRSLHRLNLNNNRLSHLAFVSLNFQLSWLSAKHNSLSRTLDGTIFHNLTELRVLDLSFNRIINVDSALESLTGLKTLILAHNCLTSLNGLGRLQSLETLVLSNNELEAFVMPKKPLPNLKKLSLANNKLRTFALNENMFNLRELRLNGNLLTHLPENTVYCGMLTILDIGNNSILQTTKDCFSALGMCKKLTSLNLAGNTKLGTNKDAWEALREIARKYIPSLRIFNSKIFFHVHHKVSEQYTEDGSRRQLHTKNKDKRYINKTKSRALREKSSLVNKNIRGRMDCVERFTKVNKLKHK